MPPTPQNTNPAAAQPARSDTAAPSISALTVLIDLPLDDDLIRSIAAVDPRVLPFTTYTSSPGGTTHDDGEPAKLEGEALDALLARADVLLTFWPPASLLAKAPNLRWIQLASAGSDHVLREGILTSHPDLLVTTASGVHAIPISEHIIGMILYFSRGFERAVRNQLDHTWQRYRPDEAYSKTVCFVGYGPIARRAAALCSALGMRVLVVRASISEPQPGLEGIDRFYPVSGLDEALAETDYLVVAAPRTPGSEQMIGSAQFKALKQGAVLINISRGALVDEAALIEALVDGTLAGAGLDVFTQEPLPESSPLWDMPNVLVTPHVSGSNPHYNARVTELFRDNLARYLKGEPLRNQVNVERGY